MGLDGPDWWAKKQPIYGNWMTKQVCLAGGTSWRDGCSKGRQGMRWIGADLVGWASGREKTTEMPESESDQIRQFRVHNPGS